MKKINSIHYGGKVIGVGLLFLVPIPSILCLLNAFFHADCLRILLYVSFGIGALLELGFFILLAVELHQDRRICRYYEAHPSSTKTPQEILNDRTRR